MRSKNFDIASNAAKIFWQHFANWLPFPNELNMQCRFAGAIAKWLGTRRTQSTEQCLLHPSNTL